MNFTYTFNAGDSALTALLALLPFILAGVLLGTLTHKLAVKKGYKDGGWADLCGWPAGQNNEPCAAEYGKG